MNPIKKKREVLSALKEMKENTRSIMLSGRKYQDTVLSEMCRDAYHLKYIFCQDKDILDPAVSEKYAP
ncbi:MAG: hypothetical protein ACLTK0_11610 [Anaerovoracaceae bacterium]